MAVGTSCAARSAGEPDRRVRRGVREAQQRVAEPRPLDLGEVTPREERPQGQRGLAPRSHGAGEDTPSRFSSVNVGSSASFAGSLTTSARSASIVTRTTTGPSGKSRGDVGGTGGRPSRSWNHGPGGTAAADGPGARHTVAASAHEASAHGCRKSSNRTAFGGGTAIPPNRQRRQRREHDAAGKAAREGEGGALGQRAARSAGHHRRARGEHAVHAQVVVVEDRLVGDHPADRDRERRDAEARSFPRERADQVPAGNARPMSTR